jgi:DnaK suppressor protein
MTMATIRTAVLRRALLGRRSQMQSAVEFQVREGRTLQRPDIGEALADVDADGQADGDERSRLHSMLVEVRTATLARIDDALLRLSTGQYGLCLECGKAIGILRLRGLPFAENCHECEGRRETQQRARQQADTIGHPTFFGDLS